MRKLKQLLVLFLLFAFTQVIAQDKTVTGKVTDANGAALAGATIKIKGGKALGTTKADGTFSVKAPANATLEVTYSGMVTSSFAVSASGSFDVAMKSATGDLNEVVVVGYGSQRKKDLTGSVVAVTSKDFVKGALTTPEQLITGKVAGVSITPNGGAPGSGSVIRIRGGASLSATNDPLIIVDGVPLDYGGIAGSPNALGMINPNDIESFNILKDASAAAIYGSRASNGVILITTKKGKSGKPRYSFSTMTSLYTPAKYVDVLSAQQFRDFVNTNGNASFKALLGSANTDWQREIYQSALGTDNALSVSGSMGKVPYRASIGYLNQNGILRTGNLKRLTASLNLSPKFFKDNLRVDINLKGTVSESRFANEGAIGSAVTFDPTKPVKVSSGRWGGYWEWLDPASTNGLKSLAPFNPVGLLEQLDNRSHVERSIGNVQFDYRFPFLKDLRANLNLGYDVSKGTGTIVINDSAAMGYRRFKDANNVFHGGSNNRYKSTRSNVLMDFYLNYVKETSFGRFDVMAGYSYQSFLDRGYNYRDFTFDGTAADAAPPNFPFGEGLRRLIGFYGRFNYSYKGKYLVTANFRRDASSVFSTTNRWGNFPSLALGWRIKEEGFLKNVGFINDLKLRAGYGITGQQAGFGLYDYLPYYGLSGNNSQYQFGNTFLNSFAPFAYDPNRKWEQTEMLNFAVDFTIANGRISGTLEYYNRKTKDLLSPVPQPAGSNFTNIQTVNIGTMTNEGVELTLNTQVIKKRDFTFDLGVNATYNKNTIGELRQFPDPNFVGLPTGGISGGTGNTIQVQASGSPRNAFFVLKQVYDEKTGKPIDGLFDDKNRDGIINTNDLYKYKQPEPVIFMGLTANMTYKKWSAGFVMRGNFDNYVYNNVHSNTGVTRNILNPIGILYNGSTEVLNSGMSGNGSNYYLSDYWVQNASFIRMDNINVGFDAGKLFSNNTNTRLGFNVQNAFFITKYKGLDPEVFGGIDNNIYARPRVFVFSVNVDF